jgi:hypothetical protein
MEGKRDALHMRNNAANGLFCGEGKATRFSRATNAWLCAKPERRRLSRGNPRVGFDSRRLTLTLKFVWSFKGFDSKPSFWF